MCNNQPHEHHPFIGPADLFNLLVVLLLDLLLSFQKIYHNFFHMIGFPSLSSTSLLSNSEHPSLQNIISSPPFLSPSYSQDGLDKENEDRFDTNGKQGTLRQDSRNLFQNITNREKSHSLCRKSDSLSFAKKPSMSLAKPQLLKRSSVLTRDSETNQPHQSIFLLFKEEKSPNLLLAEQLEDKVKDLDQRITEKLRQIKADFWQTRRTSQQSDSEGRSLLKHLKRKPSETTSPEQLKLLFLKIIPMREVLGASGACPQNSRILQGKIMSRLQTELGSDV